VESLNSHAIIELGLDEIPSTLGGDSLVPFSLSPDTTLLGDAAKFTLYFTKILSELGQIHYMKSW